MTKREEKWYKNYDAACAFKREHGHLNVPRKYVTKNNIKLGYWLETQRCAKRGTGAWKITTKQISMLTKLGINWGEEVKETKNKVSTKDKNKNFMNYAREYYTIHHNLDFPKGTKECAWLDSLRWCAASRKDKENPPKSSEDLHGRLSLKNIEELTNMGMVWNSKTYKLTLSRIESIKKYKEQYGTANVPVSYIDENGEKIGLWLARQRNNKRHTANGILTYDTTKSLTDIGISWNPRLEKRIVELEEWFAKYGNIDIDEKENKKLKDWVEEKRKEELVGIGDEILKEILNDIGIPWP